MLASILPAIIAIISKFVPDADKQAQINKEITEVAASIIQSETSSEAWITKTWRPWCMFSLTNFVILWGVHNCILKPYIVFFWGVELPNVILPVEFWHLLGLGFGVYGGARSVEKIVDIFISRRR